MKKNKKKKSKRNKRNQQNKLECLKLSNSLNEKTQNSDNSSLNDSSNVKDKILLDANDDESWDSVDESKNKLIKKIFLFLLIIIVLTLIIASIYIRKELKSSNLQAHFFHKLGQKLNYQVEHGDEEAFEASKGPFDQKLGYNLIPKFRERIKESNFIQTKYTKVSEKAWELNEYGITFPYRAKTQAGLTIRDDNGEIIYNFKEPKTNFQSFDSISDLIVRTLLFIEDKKLLDSKKPKDNPAVEWNRFLKAISDLLINKFISERKVPGGSTLATQMEKYRYSYGGRTSSPLDKLKQMFSASLKAYKDSEYTLDNRKNIVLDYINSVPLAAVRGHGEIHGLGDGLLAYFGNDFKQINEILSKPSESLTKEELQLQASAYKKVLSLFIAHRRPSEYLDENQERLLLDINKYLPLLFKENVISYPLFRTTLNEKLSYNRTPPLSNIKSFTNLKAPNSVRMSLLETLKVSSLYELDRLDLEVESTINSKVQDEVTKYLVNLLSIDGINNSKLDGYRLLEKRGNPKNLIFSLTLFEQDNGYNKLRIQTDTLNQPFNINEGVKLDLGSTAKFRTLITYLEIIEDIYQKYQNNSLEELKTLIKEDLDNLSKWFIGIKLNNPKISLNETLKLSMERRYSANPGERFFTAGGMHTFENFKREDNGKVVSVTEALRHSINLPFIRMMRDIVQYLTVKTHGYSSKNIRNMNQSQRKEYLEKFADKEGKTFISRFYGKYKGKSQNEILTILIDTVNRKPSRVATIFWFIFPKKTVEDFNSFIKQYIDHASINENEIKKYYRTYNEVAKNLSDKGYIARLHPLELWTASYLYHKPDSSLSEIFNVSKNERIEVYEWLMKTSRTHAQDSRIKTMLEAEAFIDIHERWKQTGYSLPYLVPSLATALGTSADRPDSLADLMGLILAEGIMYPKTSISIINIGKGTPFESSFEFNGGQKKRVLSSEVASIAKEGLLNIVSKGTAIRLKDGIKIGDEILQVGGKTGTGDHRYVIYRGGKKEKRVVNRTATFMFILGDKYYGVVSVLVPGIEAASFNFTSALPVQILKNLAPELENLRKDK